MSGHTPGPWAAVKHYSDSVSVVDSQGFEHVEVVNTAILLGYAEKLGIDHWGYSPDASREISDEEQAANARLIAAAPDLLSALQRTLRALDLALAWKPVRDASETIGEAQAAIAKAVQP
jgi:hypothetical protein